MKIEVKVSCPIHDSFRVRQLSGMFDVPITSCSERRFEVDFPRLDRAWRIGLIVGPSGSGKSTLARRLFGDCLYTERSWSRDRAVIDCFGDRSLREVTAILTSVGFSSPPSWLRPYHVLSGGERFRCDLAYALSAWSDVHDVSGACELGESLEKERLEEESSEILSSEPLESSFFGEGFPIVAFDEFTSVVDRNVAQIGSAAISKGIRSGLIEKRFVAVTCHADVESWLESDWVLDLSERMFHWRSVRRPSIELAIYRSSREMWGVFKPHHYLSGGLNPTSHCFVAFWRGSPVSFCATLPQMGIRGMRRISRIVTLPDYQGIGIGSAFLRWVSEYYVSSGYRVSITTGHHGMISHCRRSPRWRCTSVRKTGGGASQGRSVVSFEYRHSQG